MAGELRRVKTRPDASTLAGQVTLAERRWHKGGHAILLAAMKSGDFSKVTPETEARIYDAALQNITALSEFVPRCSAAEAAQVKFMIARYHNAALWAVQNCRTLPTALVLEHGAKALAILEELGGDPLAPADATLWREAMRRRMNPLSRTVQ